MSRFYVFLLFLLAPIVAWVVITKSFVDDVAFGQSETYEMVYERTPFETLDVDILPMDNDLKMLSIKMFDLEVAMGDYDQLFKEFANQISASIESSKDQVALSDDIYEQRITNALGQPIDFHLSQTSEIKIFELKELGYRGYIAKIKLFDPSVFKLSLAQGQVGLSETTSDAAIRTGAVLAINGGGFGAATKDGVTYTTMIGGTVVDGELVNEFIRKENEDLFFVGINRQGDLVGNIPETKEDIMSLNPYQGASFIPILIQNGNKMTLPSAWASTRHPRTIIGQYANDDLILIVVDGRQGDWSAGISLERLQDKLLELGVKDAYNLDGGGSSAMYFNGKLLNKPSDGKERPVSNHFIVLP